MCISLVINTLQYDARYTQRQIRPHVLEVTHMNAFQNTIRDTVRVFTCIFINIPKNSVTEINCIEYVSGRRGANIKKKSVSCHKVR